MNRQFTSLAILKWDADNSPVCMNKDNLEFCFYKTGIQEKAIDVLFLHFDDNCFTGSPENRIEELKQIREEISIAMTVLNDQISELLERMNK